MFFRKGAITIADIPPENRPHSFGNITPRVVRIGILLENGIE